MGGSSSKSNKKKKSKCLKLVTLGTAATGKSTFFRQLKIIQEGGFDEIENQNFVRIFRSNFLLGFKELVSNADELERRVRSKNADFAQYFREVDVDGDQCIDQEVIEMAYALWEDSTIKKIWKKKDQLAKFTIINLDYVLQNIERLSHPNSEATNEDIVRCRQRTTGVSNFEFKYGKYFINVVDVGGQKIERRKWGTVSEGAAAMLFFASLADFDIPLPTDIETTRLEESIDVWKNMIDQENFASSTVILFLNKSDIFESKISNVRMSKTFPGYKGGANFEAGVEFIKDLYLQELHDAQVKLENTFVHVTCALDTNLMQNVFEDVMGQIFKQRLAQSGIPLR